MAPGVCIIRRKGSLVRGVLGDWISDNQAGCFSLLVRGGPVANGVALVVIWIIALENRFVVVVDKRKRITLKSETSS